NGEQVPVRESNLESVLYLIPPQKQGTDAELAMWDRIRDNPTPSNASEYLKSYPQGQFTELAKLMLTPAKPATQAPLALESVAFDDRNNAFRQSRVPDDVRG